MPMSTMMSQMMMKVETSRKMVLNSWKSGRKAGSFHELRLSSTAVLLFAQARLLYQKVLLKMGIRKSHSNLWFSSKAYDAIVHSDRRSGSRRCSVLFLAIAVAHVNIGQLHTGRSIS